MSKVVMMVGDIVKVVSRSHSLHGRSGEIVQILPDGRLVVIMQDENRREILERGDVRLAGISESVPE